MESNSANSKRIAKNTLFLYVRMLILMFISFFTSRIVLDKLGIVDFGIQNVVGGFASLFVFFRSSLSNVTQRYLNIELGRNNLKQARNVFSQHLLLYAIIALIIVVIAETVGLWFVYHKLVIPEERFEAAFWVYQFTIVSLVFTLISVVYDSSVIAHENMKIYSYVGIFEGIFKLIIAYAISVIPFDKLITYSFLLLVLTIIQVLFYFFYCSKHFEECHFIFTWDRENLKDSFSMIGWNSFGTAVWAINDQGINVLLNMFFGPAVNAARGVSFHLNSAINNFGSNFYVAVRPQLIKSYAIKDFKYLFNLFFKSSKYAFYLLWIFCLPVIFCKDFILNIWLKDVPLHAPSFTVLVLIYSLVNILNNPIWSLALAVGKLRRYILIGSSVFLLSFPISYIFLKLGMPPESVFATIIVVRIIYIFVVLSILNRYIPFSKKDYFLKVIKPILVVVIVSGSFAFICSLMVPHNSIGSIITICFCICVSILSILYLGMEKRERSDIKNIIYKKIKKL